MSPEANLQIWEDEAWRELGPIRDWAISRVNDEIDFGAGTFVSWIPPQEQSVTVPVTAANRDLIAHMFGLDPRLLFAPRRPWKHNRHQYGQ